MIIAKTQLVPGVGPGSVVLNVTSMSNGTSEMFTMVQDRDGDHDPLFSFVPVPLHGPV